MKNPKPEETALLAELRRLHADLTSYCKRMEARPKGVHKEGALIQRAQKFIGLIKQACDE